MKKERLFDKFEYQDVQKMYKVSAQYAKNIMESYFEKYPKDYFALNSYVNILITLGLINKAKNVFNELLDEVSNNDGFKNSKKYSNFLENTSYIYLRILAFEERYQEMYDYGKKNPGLINKLDLTPEIYYSKIKLNISNTLEKNMNYKASQINNYNYDSFLKHLNKHLNNNLDSSSIFNKNFPLDNVLENIKDKFSLENRLYPGFFTDIMYFKFDSCGVAEGKNTDYFKVVLLHNTNNIINMYPTVEGKYQNFVDLNYLTLNENMKRLSQIDKFNKRYNR